MKRILAAVAVLLILCSCTAPSKPEEPEKVDVNIEKIYGVWVTSFELAPDSFSDSKTQYTKKINNICQKIKANGITDMFAHVRPNSDAFYKSEIFPSSDRLTGAQGKDAEFDALEIMVEQAHSMGLRIHAWINPYRVSATTDDISTLSKNNPARKLYEEKSTDVVLTAGGIYYNPASESVQKLVLDGVHEILDNYEVDGIHIDDYFYPSDDESIDSTQYTEYKTSGGTLSRDDFRRSCVSSLVSGIYRTVKAKSDKLLFTVSPAGDIDKNYNELFADVKLWCSQDGYCDYIMPQIYFGFENSSLPFESCLNSWIALGSSEKLCVGLAKYKEGHEDLYAGAGINEWIERSDIITRQKQLSESLGCSGWCLFSYTYLD